MRSKKSFIATAFAFAAMSLASASAQEANTSYRATQRDPFTGYKVLFKKKAAKTSKPTIVTPPSIEQRIEQYKAQRRAAMNLQQPAPKPTTALLLQEVRATGIFRTPRGYAAMVEATPIKLSYVIYPGEPFYDGMLVAIEENRLVFRRELRWTDGRNEVNVETKPLEQPSAADALTAQSSSEQPKQEESSAKAGQAQDKPNK